MSRLFTLIVVMNTVLMAQQVPDRTPVGTVRQGRRGNISDLAAPPGSGERGAIVQVSGRRTIVTRIDDVREAERRGFSPSQLSALGIVAGAAARINVVVGIARDSAANVLPGVPVQLRELRLGRIVGRSQTTASGEFSFPSLDPGVYAVEMVTAEGTVVALSDALTIGSGEIVQTVVQLSAPARSFVGWVGGATSSAVNSAVSSGVLAVKAGPPVSPDK